MIIKNKDEIQIAKDIFDKIAAIIPKDRLDLTTSALTNIVAQICVQGNMSKESFLGYMGVAYDLNID
jgi:hypothetical protein